MALSNESGDLPSSSSNDPVEFEETFPEPEAQTPPAPATAREAARRLSVVRSEPEAAATTSRFRGNDRRLRDADAIVKQTVESVRREEETRLAEWVSGWREEEERRLETWADERRATVKRSMEPRSSSADGVEVRIAGMLTQWQERVEERLDQRREEDQRLAERQRISDDQQLRAWRAELERTLTTRSSDGARSARRDREPRASARDAIAAATNVRDLGRALHDLLPELADTSAFALALHRDDGDEVAYRYRVATDDEVGALLRRDCLDDGPQSPAAHSDGWLRAHRAVRVGRRNATVHSAQVAVRTGDATIGVLTLQSEAEAIADDALAGVAELVLEAAPRLATLRDASSFRGA